MRAYNIWAPALCAVLAHGFQGTSPLFAFVSSPSHNLRSIPPLDEQLALSSKISSSLISVVEQCPTDTYILVSQPSVSADDFSDRDSAPHLYKMMTSANETSGEWRLTCPEVVGEVDMAAIQKLIVEKCGAKLSTASVDAGTFDFDVTNPQLVNVVFPALPHCSKARASKLLSHDSFLNMVLNQIHPRSYTVIYSTSPGGSPPPKSSQQPASEHLHSQLFDYDVEDSFPSAMHTDLKRDLRGGIKARANETNSEAALFEKYAFLSPGIFMGGFIAILLLSILYVGMLAISSLEISVAAFSKEMGPAAQKKQQQQ